MAFESVGALTCAAILAQKQRTMPALPMPMPPPPPMALALPWPWPLPLPLPPWHQVGATGASGSNS